MLMNIKLTVWHEPDGVDEEIVFNHEDGDDDCQMVLPGIGRVYKLDAKELLTVAGILVKAKTDAADR